MVNADESTHAAFSFSITYNSMLCCMCMDAVFSVSKSTVPTTMTCYRYFTLRHCFFVSVRLNLVIDSFIGIIRTCLLSCTCVKWWELDRIFWLYSSIHVHFLHFTPIHFFTSYSSLRRWPMLHWSPMLYLFYAVVCLAGDWVGGWGFRGRHWQSSIQIQRRSVLW